MSPVAAVAVTAFGVSLVAEAMYVTYAGASRGKDRSGESLTRRW